MFIIQLILLMIIGMCLGTLMFIGCYFLVKKLSEHEDNLRKRNR